MTFSTELKLAKRSAYDTLLQRRIQLAMELSTIDDLLAQFEHDLGISTGPADQLRERTHEV